jgi:hypothetical protein
MKTLNEVYPLEKALNKHDALFVAFDMLKQIESGKTFGYVEWDKRMQQFIQAIELPR